MSKTPKFLLAENPMTMDRDDHKEYIIHARKPFIMAEVNHNSDGSVDIRSIWSESIPNPDALELAKIMRRMGDWYHAYCLWEDSQPHDYEE